jgi:hypothetical protein
LSLECDPGKLPPLVRCLGCEARLLFFILIRSGVSSQFDEEPRVRCDFDNHQLY